MLATLQHLQRAHAETIERFFREHNSRSQASIDERVEAIRKALPAVQDTALLQAGAAASTSLVALLLALNGAIASLDPLIAEQVPKHPKAYLFAELPGAGPGTAAAAQCGLRHAAGTLPIGIGVGRL